MARSAEGWDNMLSEQLDLPHFLVPRHETLIEKPAEPLEVTLAPQRLELFDLSLHLIDRASNGIFGFAKAIDGPL